MISETAVMADLIILIMFLILYCAACCAIGYDFGGNENERTPKESEAIGKYLLLFMFVTFLILGPIMSYLGALCFIFSVEIGYSVKCGRR
ncbi:MAG: hypothetical protein II948_00050 [Synergistaceae bacterium]|nr:hypothetical protein [Synergistaceae bacterium]MBQ9897608.1 hypothetical protein [Synergistaceae bacterium]